MNRRSFLKVAPAIPVALAALPAVANSRPKIDVASVTEKIQSIAEQAEWVSFFGDKRGDTATVHDYLNKTTIRMMDTGNGNWVRISEEAA